jgi:hypothetical protein
MKSTKLILAAGLVLASSVALAETGVRTLQIDNVANVYGRTGVPNVVVRGNVQSGVADVTIAGRTIVAAPGQTSVTTGDADINVSGRS